MQMIQVARFSSYARRLRRRDNERGVKRERGERHNTFMCEVTTRVDHKRSCIQGVSFDWGVMLTKAPIKGNRAWEAKFLFHAPVSLDWGTPVVHFS